MFETILFLCVLGVLTPFLVILVLLYNARRRLNNLDPVSGGDALKDIIKNFLKDIDKAKDTLPKTETKPKTNTKTDGVKAEKVEDAEFRELKR